MTFNAFQQQFSASAVLQDPRKVVEGARTTFLSAMSDAGLKPTVVYHNLTPAELYEKVRLKCFVFLFLPPPPPVRRRSRCGTQCSLHPILGISAAGAMIFLLAWFGSMRRQRSARKPLKHRTFASKYSVESLLLSAWHLVRHDGCPRAQALLYEPGSHLVSSGALATLSGAKTGRTPKDKRVVREPETEADIWCAFLLLASLSLPLFCISLQCYGSRFAAVSLHKPG